MNHAKYDRRSRLTESHLQDILRIRINGVSLEKFDPSKYVDDWLERHLHTDDPTASGKSVSEEQSETHDSNLF